MENVERLLSIENDGAEAPKGMVFVVDDDPAICTALKRLIRSVGTEALTFTSAGDFLRATRSDVPSCLVLDVHLPDLSGLSLQEKLTAAKVDLPIVFITGNGDIPTTVRAMKGGALDFLTKPVKEQDLLEAIQRGIEQHRHQLAQRAEACELQRRYDSLTPREREAFPLAAGQIDSAIDNASAYREISELKDKPAQEKFYLEEQIRSGMNFENIIGNSPPLKHVLELVETVATSDSTVLLLGETGTGKELIARAIHDRSRRKERTFVKLNCAAIPTGLLESELFGHEKGAFTGAITQKLGRMELADQGTLFLDEVGDIPIEIQPKLLRALQEREFERLGSTHTRKVNVRLVAATNRDLEKMIADREFRSDLYYRLHVFPIRIPPLRERKEDIPQLVSYFVQKFAKQMQKKIDAISPAVMTGLTAWHWPGNIRELENFIERAVIVTRSRSLEAPLEELHKSNTDQATQGAAEQDPEGLARFLKKAVDALRQNKSVTDNYANKQREEIERALTDSKGRVGGATGAAARMGINRSTLISRIRKFGIYPKQYI
ncbi:MAG TPA: sigma-54 dependent transcriptional regulator [Candidatus Acidoferrum sp.]|nr:sigma-54 dependent transcriptional regulator [Candidatus Acidoferrum sp.]